MSIGYFFFFQAEDGIRDYKVTGVQTCALPILTRKAEAGQIANPGGEVLFRVASGGEVEMRGQIAEQDLAQVKTGQAATVYLTGIERPFTGQVRLLGASIDPQT